MYNKKEIKLKTEKEILERIDNLNKNLIIAGKDDTKGAQAYIKGALSELLWMIGWEDKKDV